MTLSDPLLRETLGMIGIALTNLVGLVLVDRLARKMELPPEGSRKLVHVSIGLLAVPIPWLIRSELSMAILAIGSLGFLIMARRRGLLRSVHSVERTSWGDRFFPIGIALLFFVGHDDPPVYLIGLSYLVVSDAVAALVGRRYGRASFAVERERRSVEGSVTFFFVSFLAAHLILLLGTDVPRLTSVLVATQLALLATGFEAISMRGNDNVLVPLVTSLIVLRLVELPQEVLARDLVIQLSIGGLVAWMTARWRFAGATGAIVLALFLYGAYALGGVLWLIAPLLAVAAYVALRSLRSGGRSVSEGHHQVLAVFYVTVVGATLYIVSATAEVLGTAESWISGPHLLLPAYLGVAAGQLSILVYTLWRPWDAPAEALDPGLVPAVLASLLMTPFAFAGSGESALVLLWIITLPLVALALYRKARNGSAWPRAVPWNSRLQAAAVAAALMLLIPLHLVLFA